MTWEYEGIVSNSYQKNLVDNSFSQSHTLLEKMIRHLCPKTWIVSKDLSTHIRY